MTDLAHYIIKHKRVYKKLDHFKEVLSQFQGREGEIVPGEVLHKIRSDLAENDTPLTIEDVKKPAEVEA